MELKSSLQGNEVNYENIKNPVFYDFDVKGVSADFEPTKFKNFCASNGFFIDFFLFFDFFQKNNDFIVKKGIIWWISRLIWTV